MNDITPLLTCTGLAKQYTGRMKQSIIVLRDVNLTVQPGEVVVITGRSGNGKSTLFNLLGGLDLPDTGSIIFDGQRMESLDTEAVATLRREKIGIIFQNFNLLSTWTAFENVEAALLHTAMRPEERQARVLAQLTALGLAERTENLPCELSVGQQQRVAVARTLVNDPLLLLADEPTGDVDPETAQEIIAQLLRPVQERGAALLVATHGTFPLEHADRIYDLQDGVVTERVAVS